jgi:Ca2+/Na+ antiporter
VLFDLKLFGLILASAAVSDSDRVFNRMSAVTRYVYENAPNNQVAGYIIFILVFILSAIVYKLGFAKKLSLGKNIIIYIFLFLGCILLTFFALFLPMIEGLIVAALVLILYKIRLWREKREEKEAS